MAKTPIATILENPLALDKEHVTTYNIGADVEASPVHKLSFLQDQLGQLQAMHWRARVDMLHAARLQEDENPTLREKGLSNMGQHRNEVQQSIGAIKMIKRLIEQLREEYPELQVEG